MDVEKAIKERHSTRRYGTKPINWDDLMAICDMVRYAPFAGNVCTARLVVVSDIEKIKQIAQAAVQDFLAFAPYLLVVCSDNTQVERLYGERGKRYSRQQAGATIQNMLLKMTELGLASCWVGAFDDNAVKRILAIPNNFEVEAILPVAHKTLFFRFGRRKRQELYNIMFFDRYGQRVAKPPKKAEAK